MIHLQLNIQGCYYLRWWWAICGSVLGILITYFYDILPMYRQYENTFKAEAMLVRSIKSLQEKQNHANKKVDKPKQDNQKLVSKLTAIAFANGISTQSMVFHSSVIHAQMQGDFRRLVMFVNQVANELPAIFIGDFSYQAGGKSEMDINLQQTDMSNVTSALPINFNGLFCGEFEINELSVNKNKKNDQYELRLMRMIGFLEQGEKHIALLQLPDGSLIEAYPGMSLGKERGVVSEMNNHQVSIGLPDHQRVIIVSN